MTRLTITLLYAATLSGCTINYHLKPKGECKTPGASPLASNCPAPAKTKAK
jgi:hypothetical protein